jgi:GT2 family glycosyltransferase
MLFVVIPVFNRKNFTKDCLVSLRNQTYKEFKTIVVDDGSTDGTDEMLQNEFPEVYVVKGDGNLFWTASVNLGIRDALRNGATAVMTLNNDVIASPDFINQMVCWGKKMPKSLIGAMALDVKTKSVIYGGEILDWKTNKRTELLDIIPASNRRGLHEVTYFPGRGLLIPKEVFDTIGLFDEEKFPHYFADYDFTSQARIAGYKVYCNYDAHLYTYPDESGDVKNRKKKTFRNYYNHLFGIKGGGNLVNFTRFTFRNCPMPFIPYFLLNGYLRRIFGYLIK